MTPDLYTTHGIDPVKYEIIKPQEGPQCQYLSNPADIIIYGGAAGGGKTYALLLDVWRCAVRFPGFTSVIFRRTFKQVKNPGGLWDTAMDIFSRIPGAYPRETDYSWTFPNSARLNFAHMDHENDKLNWQGSQVPFIAFDELTHFSASQFWYLMSRNRSMCGMRPVMRGTCNPDPESFVAVLIKWWIDQDTGYPIPERGGVIRWFVQLNSELIWADTQEELLERFGKKNPGMSPKSLTFIPSSVEDNKLLLDANPEYMANLMALPLVEQERLLKGNWKIRPSSGMYFRRSFFEEVQYTPDVVTKRVRFWDRAATEPSDENPDPDWTVGIKMSRGADGFLYVEHMVRFRGSPHKVRTRIRNIASQDGIETEIGLEQEPGASGKVEVQSLIQFLIGYAARAYPVSNAKEVRAAPVSAQAEAGFIKVVRGPWNDAFYTELENFPPTPDVGHDDIVDGLSGAFDMIKGRSTSAGRPITPRDVGVHLP